jgi:hypothetical protein
MSKQENLTGRILFINLLYNGAKGHRIRFVHEKKFTREDAFKWVEKESSEVNGVVTNFKII